MIDSEEDRFLLDVKKGVYWHLNEPAMDLLEALREGRSFDSVVREMAEAVQIDEHQVRSDYNALLEDLRRAGLIEGEVP